MRDIAAGSISISLSRTLSAFDSQDRAIDAGEVNVLWAYGTGPEVLTSGVRNGTHIVLFDKDMKLPAEPRPVIPDDAWGNLTIRATAYVVPNASTSFACSAMSAPVPYGHSASLVAFEPVLGASNHTDIIQSMVLYACPKFDYFEQLNKSTQCGVGSVPRPATFCSDVLYRWAPGMGRFVLPPDVGFKINEENQFLVLETKYENPNQLRGVVDTSGVRYHYSNNPRRFAAGTLVLGDTLGSLRDKTVSGSYGDVVSSTCPSMCTAHFRDNINIFASSPAMGSFGKSITTQKHWSHATGGAYKQTVNKISHWSKSRQWTYTLPKPVRMSIGEQLSTTCVYDTRKRPGTTFGTGAEQEMCLDFLFYYPRQDLSNAAGMQVVDSKIDRCGFSTSTSPNGTMCGSKVLPTRMSNIPLNTEDILEDSFGTAPEVCEVAEIESSPEPPSTPKKERACFPRDALVNLRDGRSIAMAELKLGDQVLSGRSHFSTVFAFTHRLPLGLHKFVMIKASNHTLVVSPSHYIYANDRLIAAADVVVGDTVETETGIKHQVTEVREVLKQGLYNPQTTSGNIIVNGVKVSCYTTTVAPRIAHAALTFLRALATTTGSYFFSLSNGLYSIPLSTLLQ